MKKSIKLSLLGALVALALSACGKIPDNYQCSFTDNATGTKLTLGGSEGALRLNTGRELKASADNLQFEALLEGKPGIYIRPAAINPDIIEIFWFQQRKTTRKTEAEFTWEESEVLYSRMDSKLKEKVNNFKMIHCENGMLMLDLSTKTWNGGCPAGKREYDFVRTDKP